MANLEAPGRGAGTNAGTYVLNAGTLVAAAIAVTLMRPRGGRQEVAG